MEAYRVILDIEGLEVYSLRRKIINKVKNRYNLAEDFLEDIRLKIDDTLLPRKGAIYVCYNISNAHKWYKKIDAKQQYNYYIYKLLLHAYSGGYPFSISGDIRSLPS